MEVVTAITYCDICKEPHSVQKVTYPVLFQTEQTEGRDVTPYVYYQKFDLCDDCLTKACVIHGWGAQGNNEFEIKSIGGLHNGDVHEPERDSSNQG